MCVVHDLGEAIHGDIPAVEQAAHPDKGEQERADLLQLTRHLDAPLLTACSPCGTNTSAASPPKPWQ